MAKRRKADPSAQPPGKEPLSPDDWALWQRVAESVKPLPRREARPAPLREPEPAGQSKAARRAAPPQARSQPGAESEPAQRPLEPGRIADLDRRTGERLRRGQLAIEAVLDLHGYRQEQAEEALEAFLLRCQERGLRSVVVVTGKGRIGEAAGVLRARLPDWLNRPQNRARVLAVSQAQPKHGGAGAFYILLKRRRSS